MRPSLAVSTGRRPAVSAFLGALGGAGSLLAIPLYIELRGRLSDSMYTFELLLPGALVGLPLLAIWQFIEARKRVR